MNPLAYPVDALRGIMIQAGQSALGSYVDLRGTAVVLAVLASIAGQLYPALMR